MNGGNIFKAPRRNLPKILREIEKVGIPYEIRPMNKEEVDVMLPDLPVREYDIIRKIFLDYSNGSRIK